MGHASMRAALTHQHANSERDRAIAVGMDRRIAKQAKWRHAAKRAARGTISDGTAGATGTPMARKIRDA